MNFALIMLLLIVLTGTISLLDRLLWRPRRGLHQKEPWYVEYAHSFFPVILVVFILRSFLFEPFRIPSGSMLPTLLVGDFILVNKFTYGIRLPVINQKIISVNYPQAGDVVVFRYPEDPNLDYIKRVVAVGGDTITYANKRLFINDKPLIVSANGKFTNSDLGAEADRFQETLGQITHQMMVINERPPIDLNNVRQFKGIKNCRYSDNGFSCKVPIGHYFMMGDNRDGSSDSRYWGFVPDDHIVGKAVFVWMHFGRNLFERIGVIH